MIGAGALSGPDDGGVYTQPLGDGEAGLRRVLLAAGRQSSPGSRFGALRHALLRRTLQRGMSPAPNWADPGPGRPLIWWSMLANRAESLSHSGFGPLARGECLLSLKQRCWVATQADQYPAGIQCLHP
jgi:hypothetical protein